MLWLPGTLLQKAAVQGWTAGVEVEVGRPGRALAWMS